jgi:hypothetical protein
MRALTTGLLAALGILAACSSQQLYTTSQEWQRQECRKLGDAAEQKRCLERASMPYDRYEKERGKASP